MNGKPSKLTHLSLSLQPVSMLVGIIFCTLLPVGPTYISLDCVVDLEVNYLRMSLITTLIR